MKISPEALGFEVRIDSGKGTGHHESLERVPVGRPCQESLYEAAAGRDRPRGASRTFSLGALATAPDRSQLDAAEGFGPEVFCAALRTWAGVIAAIRSGQSFGSSRGSPNRSSSSKPLGPLLDGLEVEDPGTGQVAAGAIDLVVGEGARAHGADLVGDRGDDPIGLFGHGAGIDAEEARAGCRPSR